MSGDVFGNGMLRSPHIRLVAAFDHRHIFLDPDPDPRELRRAAPGCSRCRGPRGLTTIRARSSAGGGVWPRAADRSRCRRRRGWPSASDAGGARAYHRRADLRHPGRPGRPAVERRDRHLREGHPRVRTPKVGDRWKDAVRIDATRLRARVIGEGGNLGLTQAADRVLARRRPGEHRLHRQLGRRGHLRPRGQHRDPARRRDPRRGALPLRPGTVPRGHDRRRGGAGAAAQLRAEHGAGGVQVAGRLPAARARAVYLASWSGTRCSTRSWTSCPGDRGMRERAVGGSRAHQPGILPAARAHQDLGG